MTGALLILSLVVLVPLMVLFILGGPVARVIALVCLFFTGPLWLMMVASFIHWFQDSLIAQHVFVVVGFSFLFGSILWRPLLALGRRINRRA